MALGASPRDVDALIQDIKRAGFPVPRVVDVRSWRSWTSYGYSPVSMKDIEGTVRGPITASTYLYTSAFVPSPSLAPVFIENGYALDFTARGNPGDPYRDPPRGGSCFDKGALVLMADRRTLTPVERLRPGDKIWSPAANAPVSIAVIAHPSVSGRSLHAINGKSDFRFTDTHPFVVHEDSGSDAHNACVDPEKLGLFSPTWSDLGTQKLSSSSIALIQIHLTENRTLTESEMRITSLDTVIPHVEGDHFEHWVRQVKDKPESHGILYDIILDKTELCPGDVPADYVAGTRDMLVRVGSELPPLAAADQNIVMIFRNIIKEISTISYSLDESLGSELSLPDYWHRLAVMREELRILEPLLRGNWLQASLSVARKVGSQSSPVMALVSGVSQGSLFRQEDGNPTAGNSGENEDLNISEIGSAFMSRKSREISETSGLTVGMRSTAESSGVQSRGFRSVMSFLYEQFVKTQTHELRAYLELGFRTLPVTRTKKEVGADDIIAISVWGVQFHASKLELMAEDLYDAHVAEMAVQVGGEPLPIILERIGVADSVNVQSKRARFWTSSSQHRIWYYGLSRSSVVGLLDFQSRVEARVTYGGNGLSLVGEVDVHVTAQHGYTPVSISLGYQKHNENVELNPYEPPLPATHTEIGELFIDVRWMDINQATEELSAFKMGWSAEMARARAVELALTAGEGYKIVVDETVKKIAKNMENKATLDV